jgi:hypothetical protein
MATALAQSPLEPIPVDVSTDAMEYVVSTFGSEGPKRDAVR